MIEELERRRSWLAEGKKVGFATVARVSGSAPRPVGSRFMISSAGEMAGSVSGGCVENDVFLRLQKVMEDDRPELVGYGIADEDAFEVGLACGGRIQVFLEDQSSNPVLDAVEELLQADGYGSFVTMVGGPGLGQSALLVDGLVSEGGIPADVEASVAADASRLLDRGLNLTLEYGPHEVYIESVAPAPRMVIFGAVHIAQELVPMARRLGYHVTVSDARPAFLTEERFPDADQLLSGWPDQLDLAFDRGTAVVILSHDARFEDPLWPQLLVGEFAYIGAMGSSKTAQRRRERLAAAGFDPRSIDRIHGPIGKDIGASTPAEIAVAILAEVVSATRRPDSELDLIGTGGYLPGN
ncbi:MAG: XdhC family protein [Acidimicrobiia bacterium]